MDARALSFVGAFAVALGGCSSWIDLVKFASWDTSETVSLSVVPEPPVTGDLVRARVPFTETDECGAWAWSTAAIAIESRDGAQHILLTATATAPDGLPPCAAQITSDRHIDIPIGALAAGKYVLHAGGIEHNFEVLPEGTDPGRLPAAWKIKLEIAARHRFTAGAPRIVEHDPRCWAELNDPLLWRQIAAAFPALSIDERRNLADAAAAIHLEHDGLRRVLFDYEEGDACKRRRWVGTASIDRAGNVTISRPFVISEDELPC